MNQLTSEVNLLWAWGKAKKAYDGADFWFDEAEVAGFEACLGDELRSIAQDLARQTYALRPLRPVPYPKKFGLSGEREIRQMFSIAVRDQVAWLAFVNVVGPWLDMRMPAWSYGHRLYQAVWREDHEEGGPPQLRIGHYRHASGRLYRSWRGSWPLFRRHLFLTVRAMSDYRDKREDLDETERSLMEDQDSIESEFQLTYLRQGYWKESAKHIFWAGIDIEKFYPSLNRLNLIQQLVPQEYLQWKSEIESLGKSLLSFTVNCEGCDEAGLCEVGLNSEEDFMGLPTGLFVAGFLANVAMLPIDSAVGRIQKRRGELGKRVAHFRYVDDHVVLAQDFDSLVRWIERYKNILKEHGQNLQINKDKIEPKELAELLWAKTDRSAKELELDSSQLKTAIESCSLDPKFPRPLTTKTLGLMYNLAQTRVDLLDPKEEAHFLTDLEHLLLAEFPETEIREKTRVSFAARRMSRTSGNRMFLSERLASLARETADLKEQRKGLSEAQVENRQLLDQKISELETQKLQLTKEVALKRDFEHKRMMSLLTEAVRRHPSNLKLWEHLLNYAKLSAVDTLDAVWETLSETKGFSGSSGTYLSAFIIQKTSNLLLTMAYGLVEHDLMREFRKRAVQCLVSMTVGIMRRLDSSPSEFYLVASRKAVSAAALAAMKLMLEKANDLDLGPQQRAECHQACEEALKLFIELGSDQVSSWVWWTESRRNDQLSTEPSPFWKEFSEKLHESDRVSWALWAKYPRHLGDRAFNRMISIQENQLQSPIVDEGWLCDSLDGVSDKGDRAKRAAIISKRFASAVRARKKVEDYLTLVRWLNELHRIESKNAFDPRVGEWTHLEIITQIATILNADKSTSVYPIHPRNFLIPSRWIETPPGHVSWEKWRRIVDAEGGLVELRTSKDPGFSPISDKRFGGGSPRFLPDWDRIRGLAMLLLGLIARSFQWPAVWNPTGHQIFLDGLARKYLELNPCSSWTTAILSGTLLPRPLETSLLIENSWSSPTGPDDDTTIDPPIITRLTDFIRYLNEAQRALEEHQFAVSRHQPRQLIPVNLLQKKRREWEEAIHDED